MLHGQIVLIRIKDGYVQIVSRNIQQISVIVLNEDTGEFEYPTNEFKDEDKLNAELDQFSNT